MRKLFNIRNLLNKKWNILFLAILFIFIAFFSSCFYSNKKRITFKVDNDIYSVIEYIDGDLEIEMPEEPSIEGMVFEKWEYIAKNDNCVEFTKESIRYNLENNQIVYAVFYAKGDIFETTSYFDDVSILGIKPTATVPENLVIPKEINGSKVSAISENAFKYNTTISSVTIPSTVTEIGSSAFEDCTSIKSIHIADDGDDLNIFSKAFKNCSSLTSLVIPNRTVQIQMYTLDGCTSLSSLTIPYIGVFLSNYSKTLYDSMCLKSIFNNQTTLNLKKLIVTRQTEFSSYILRGTSIEEFIVESEATKMGNIFDNSSYDTLKKVDFSKTKLTALSEDSYLFSGFKALDQVILPPTLTSIPFGAFQECTALTYLNIPDSLTTIEPMAFAYSAIKDINLLYVTNISMTSFYSCESLTSLTLLNVEKIPENAFYNCTSLISVEIPKATSIGEKAFYGCSNLTTITYPSLITIEANAFESCTSLTDVIIPKTVTKINTQAFKDCSGIKSFSVEKDSALTSISSEILKDVNSIESISLPFICGNKEKERPLEDLFMSTNNKDTYKANYYYVPKTLVSIEIFDTTTIVDDAFYNLYYVTNIYLGDCVTKICSDALYNTNITSFKMPNSLTSIETVIGGRTDDDISIFVDSLENYLNISQYFLTSFSNSLQTYIKAKLFVNDNEITDLDLSTIPIKNISQYKFANFTNIESVILPTTLEEIGIYAFMNDSLITSISLPDGLKKINIGAFEKTSITSVNIPASVEILGGFSYITALTSVTFNPNSSLNRILVGCFRDTSISSISIPQSCESLESYAFYNCSSLINFEFETNSKLNSFGQKVLYNTNVLSLKIPSCVKYISTDALSGSVIRDLEYPSVIEHYNLGLSYSTTVVKINSESLIEDAFLKVVNITSLDLTDVTTYSKTAFSDGVMPSRYLRNCTIIVRSVEDYLNIETESDGYRIMFTNTIDGTTYYNYLKDSNGNYIEGIIDLSSTTLTHIPAYAFYCYPTSHAITKIILPTTMTSIEKYAFTSNFALKEIEVNSNLEIIDNRAFYNCSSLEDFDFNNTSISSIGDYAFFGCCKLTSLYFPNTIKNIGDYAFYNCNQIAFIDFGSADLITNLNSYIFYGTAISSIIIPASVTSISSNAFNSCTNLTTVTFALGSKISSISGGYTFKGCTSLLSISFPDTLRSIGSCIFMNCTSLISLDISNTQIYSIPQYAFSGCSSLETLYLPNNLTSIGSSAFINCSALTNIYTNNSSNVTINDSAFQDCTSLIYIGDISGNSPITIGYVGDTSFAGCKSILEIHLTNTVTSIGIQTFKDCEELQYINIPTSVSSIGLDAFEGAFTKSIPQGDNSTTYGIYFDFGTETSSVWTYIAINHVTNFRSEFKLNKTDSIYRITMNIKIYSSSSYTKATMLRKTS